MNLNTLSNVKAKEIKSKEIREDQTQIKPNIKHALQYNHSDIHMFDLSYILDWKCMRNHTISNNHKENT